MMKLPFAADLTGKTAVVTGAGGTLCSLFAAALASAGAAVALLDKDADSAEKNAVLICNEGGKAKAYACDVLDRDILEKVRAQVLADFGPCDILLNGAGGNHPSATTENEVFSQEDIGQMKTFFDLDQSGMEFVFHLNFMGTLLPTQVFARDMIGRKGGCIVNISSMNAFTPLTKIPAYSGAKAAVSNLTQWLAVHFAKTGIRCNALAPGFFVSKQNTAMLFHPDGTPTQRSEKILRGTPAERFGKPEELLGPLLFLVSEQASGFVNGIVLPVDGGFSAYSGV